jgi:hypothetical protein
LTRSVIPRFDRNANVIDTATAKNASA